MADPWTKIKDEWPVIFTATTVSILSSTAYHASINLTSFAFWKSFLSILVSVGLALAIVYAVVWILHGTHSKLSKRK